MKNSITKHTNPVVMANTIYMAGGVSRSSYLLVEGPSDFQIFNRFIAQTGWSIFWLEGKLNVIACIRELLDRGFNRFQALLDNDPLDHAACPGPVVYTDSADLEAELLKIPHVCEGVMISSALRRHGDILERHGQTSWWGFLSGFVRPWTLARLAVSVRPDKPSLRDFPIGRVVGTSGIELDTDKVCFEINRRMGESADLTPTKVAGTQLSAEEIDNLHCGHHLTSAAAWIASQVLGAPKLGISYVEDKLRSLVNFDDFAAIPAIIQLQEMAHNRGTCLWGDERCPRCSVQPVHSIALR